MGRGGLSRIGSLMDGFTQAYDAVDRVTTDAGLRRIAETKPEDFQQYSPDQAAQLEAAANAKDADGNPLYTVQANEGGTYSVTPTAGGDAGTMTPGLRRIEFLGKTYDKPLTDNEQTAIETNAAADFLARRDPAAATKLRIAGLEAKKLTQDDTDQQSIRSAWGTPDDTQPIRGLQRIDAMPTAGSNAHGTLATPQEANESLSSLGGADGLTARSGPVAQAQPVSPDEASAAEARINKVGGSMDSSQAANAEFALRKAGGREAANSYLQRKAPQIIDAYLKAGKIDSAKAFRDFVDSEDGRAYTAEWGRGVRSLAAGDYHGAIDSFQRMYNSQRVPDGNTVKITPNAGGLNYTAEFYGPDGQLLNSITKPTSDIAKYAAQSLAPEKMAEFMAQQQGKREAEGATLDRQIQLEHLRQGGQENREDRRDERLGMRLDVQTEMLDRRLSAGGVTLPQQRSNAEIDAARAAVSGMSSAEILRRSQKATNTGRENPDYDPSIAHAANLAGRRKIGADDYFDSRAGQRTTAQPSQTSIPSRFAQDPAMQGMHLGRQTANGLEVFDQAGKHIGYYR